MKLCTIIIFFLFLNLPGNSQAPTINFRHLTADEGLSDALVHAVTQDKYGFIWIGTSYGLNRFDGIHIKTYFSKRGDKNSIPDNLVTALYNDSKGNLWIGTNKGCSRFDYTHGRFTNFTSDRTPSVNAIREDAKGNIWLATNTGLWIADQKNKSIQKFIKKDDTAFQKKFNVFITDVVTAPDGKWYCGTNTGVKIFNPVTYEYSEIRLDTAIHTVPALTLDSSGYLWVINSSPSYVLSRINIKNNSYEHYNRFTDAVRNWKTNVIQHIITDKKGRVWVTSDAGLSLYNPAQNNFIQYSSGLLLPNYVLDNRSSMLYQDKSENIWMGTAGFGVTYFNSDKDLFYDIRPTQNEPNSLPDVWARTACEDNEGNLWLGTAKGLTKFNRQTQSFTLFQNAAEGKPVIHSNSIRSLLCDARGNIWIGTAKGLNRYHPQYNQMDFFTLKDGIPLSFFWMLAQDGQGHVWLGSAGGLFCYNVLNEQFEDLTKNPLLAEFTRKNIQALFVDSHDRLWIGVLNTGAIMYNGPGEKLVRLTVADSMITDDRFSSFAEDKNGVIWMGSEDGMTAYDPVKKTSKFYRKENGFPSDRLNNLMVDSLDRLWVGTSNGLCMLDKNRNKVRRFDLNDGLITNQFNEQAAYKTTDGLFIYPTYRGFVLFKPENYKDNQPDVPVYITSFKVSDKELDTETNIEDVKQLDLSRAQNFFSIELAGLNYMNPRQCSYAYKLEPFDKDWVYTTKNEVNYTNVPAGKYTFHYKVMNAGREMPEKTIGISVAAVFYKTWWFRTIVALALVAGLFAFYRYRINHNQKIMLLQSKAQLLEKEKALVMYENLKQQLNPHFLFNSLTSLSSLIQQDQKLAKQFLDQMSKIYRYILKNRDSEWVPLVEDIRLAEVYTQLQQTRFQKGLQVNIIIDEENNYRKIVPVTLQNMIENAIKHNIIDTETPLIVDIFVEDDYIVVRNNLQRKNFVETSNRQGLGNMQSLYNYLSGRKVIIMENERYFTVKIPLV